MQVLHKFILESHPQGNAMAFNHFSQAINNENSLGIALTFVVKVMKTPIP